MKKFLILVVLLLYGCSQSKFMSDNILDTAYSSAPAPGGYIIVNKIDNDEYTINYYNNEVKMPFLFFSTDAKWYPLLKPVRFDGEWLSVCFEFSQPAMGETKTERIWFRVSIDSLLIYDYELDYYTQEGRFPDEDGNVYGVSYDEYRQNAVEFYLDWFRRWFDDYYTNEQIIISFAE